MLAEIETTLLKILKERMPGISKENLVIDEKPKKTPALVVSNVDFRFDSAGMVENADRGKIEIDERFDGDGSRASFKLQQKPLKGSARVRSSFEASPEESGRTVNYEEGSVDFKKPPPKGKGNIIVTYLPEQGVLTLRTLKVIASYTVEAWSPDRVEADSIAEKVVTTLLSAEDEFLQQNIEAKPIEGKVIQEESDGIVKIQLKYVFERELRLEQVVGPIQKIEITPKNF